MKNDQPRPKRVMRIITQLHISGPALQAVLLTSRLNDLGYEGQLVTGAPADADDSMMAVAHQYAVQPVIVRGLENPSNPLAIISSFWRLYRLMRRTQPDIVHTHSTSAGFLGRVAARMAGVPVVVHTMHEHPFRGYYNRLKTLFFLIVERSAAHLSDSITTLSEGLRKELVDTYHVTSKNRLTILPLGFDLEVFAAVRRHAGTFRQQWQIADTAPLIGIIGRLMPVKNHDLFLEAAALIHRQLPDARFVIVGDGLLQAHLQESARILGITNMTIFTGWQQHTEAIYSDLDVLVISSLNEGTPVPIIEALAAGCPVVATSVGGIPDLLDGGMLGVLVPSGDAEALSEAVIRTLKNPPDLLEAQKAILRRYGIDRLAADIDSLYRGLLAKKQH